MTSPDIAWMLAKSLPKLLRTIRSFYKHAVKSLARRKLARLCTPLASADIVFSSNHERALAETLRDEFKTAGWKVHVPNVPLGERSHYRRGISVEGHNPRLLAEIAPVLEHLAGWAIQTETVDGSDMHEDNPKWAIRDARVQIRIGYPDS